MSWQRPIQGCLVWTGCLMSAVVWGQAGEDGQGNDPAKLDPISVTATGRAMSPFDYPGMVSVVDNESLRDRQPSSLDDAFGRMPNVEFTGGPRRTGEVPSIRGFDGSDVVVTVDGARQNFLSGHDGRVFVDPSLLREVEVVRGPSSSLYGSGATGGVIALRTLRARDLLGPDDNAGVRFRGSYQSVNEEESGGVTAYGRPVEELGLLANINARNSGTIELGDGNELTNSDDDIVSGLLKANWQPGDHSELELSYIGFDNDAREPNNGQGAGGDNSVDKAIESETARLRYDYSDPANPWLDVKALAYRSEQSVDERRLDDDGLGPQGELLTREVETTGFRVDNRSRFAWDGGSVSFTLGGEYYEDEQTAEAGGGTRGGVPSGEFDFRAAFAQAQLRFNKLGALPGQVSLLPGIRYDGYKASGGLGAEPDDSELSPRLGVTWKPTPETLLFANRADAFRAPTLNELFSTGEHFTIPRVGTNNFVPNTDLAPQRTETWEAGAGLDLSGVLVDGDTFTIKATHFETDAEDFIDQEVDQPFPPACFPPNCNGTTRAVNVGSAELWGQEFQGSYRVGAFTASFGFSRIDGEDDQSGDKLGVLTPAQGTLDLRYELADLDSTVGGRLLVADDFDKVNEPAEERDAYEVVDLSYRWQPRQPGLRGLNVRAGVDNVFDEAYSRVFTGAAEPGRNIKLSVSYNLRW